MATGRIGVTPTLGVRWSKAPASGTTSLSGLDDSSVSLVYSVGYEQVYRNGVLLSRGNDYTATTGTTVTLTEATIAGDLIEIFAQQLVPLTDAISKGQFTAKGTLLSATAASTPGVLAVGANGTVLTAASGESTGLQWATPSSGGMTLLSTTTLSGATTTISGISQAYTDLYVAIYGMTFDVDGYARIYLRETATNQNINQIINYDADAGATTANSTRILPVAFNAQKAAQTGNNIGLQIRNYTEAVANYRNFTWAGYHNYSDGGATVKAFHGGGGVLGSSAINALHFEAAGGAASFSSGTVKIWGIK